jgi:hypothetical protein
MPGALYATLTASKQHPREARLAQMLKRDGRCGITRVATPGGGKDFSRNKEVL